MSQKDMHLRIGSAVHAVTLHDDGGAIRIVVGEVETELAIVSREPGLLVVDGPNGRVRIDTCRDGGRVAVVLNGRAWSMERTTETEDRRTVEDQDGTLESPMTGKVVKVSHAVGDVVEAHRTVVVVEAMKMEHRVKTPFDAVVTEVLCARGDQVKIGQVLARLKPHDGGEA